MTEAAELDESVIAEITEEDKIKVNPKVKPKRKRRSVKKPRTLLPFNRCTFIFTGKRVGDQCKIRAIKNSSYCRHHDPNKVTGLSPGPSHPQYKHCLLYTSPSPRD